MPRPSRAEQDLETLKVLKSAKMSAASIAMTLGRSARWVEARIAELDAPAEVAPAAMAKPPVARPAPARFAGEVFVNGRGWVTPERVRYAPPPPPKAAIPPPPLFPAKAGTQSAGISGSPPASVKAPSPAPSGSLDPCFGCSAPPLRGRREERELERAAPAPDPSRMRHVFKPYRRRERTNTDYRTRYEGVKAASAPQVERLRAPNANVVRFAARFLAAEWPIAEVAHLFDCDPEQLLAAVEAA